MRPSSRYQPAVPVLALAILLAACQPGHPSRPASEFPVIGVHDVIARDLQFEPPVIQVTAGATVTWHFEDGAVPHNVKGDGFSSPVRKSGTFSHRFDQAGTFQYRCTLHADMTGRVIVKS